MNIEDIIKLVNDENRSPVYAGKLMKHRDYCRDFVVNNQHVVAICNEDFSTGDSCSFGDHPHKWTILSEDFQPLDMMRMLQDLRNMKIKTVRAARIRGLRISTNHPNMLVQGPDSMPAQKMPFCNDCTRTWPDPYMLQDSVWKSVVKEPKCFLCFRCIEARLDRKLVEEDFTSANINSPIRLGIQMALAQV